MANHLFIHEDKAMLKLNDNIDTDDAFPDDQVLVVSHILINGL